MAELKERVPSGGTIELDGLSEVEAVAGSLQSGTHREDSSQMKSAQRIKHLQPATTSGL